MIEIISIAISGTYCAWMVYVTVQKIIESAREQ